MPFSGEQIRDAVIAGQTEQRNECRWQYRQLSALVHRNGFAYPYPQMVVDLPAINDNIM